MPWLLVLVLLAGCQGCSIPVPELDTPHPAFMPAVDFVGWVEGLPRQPQARTYFGCDSTQGPCEFAGGLRVAVTTDGNRAVVDFLPSVFCDAVPTPVIPIDHFSRQSTLVAPIDWNDAHQGYEAHGQMSLSAPGADLCWQGSSVIFTMYWEVHASPLPPGKDWSAP